MSEAIISKQIFDEQNAKITGLETELAAEKENHLATLQVNEALQQQIEILELAAKRPGKPADAKVKKIPTASFKVDKVEFVFTVPAFSYKGKKITSEQALADKDLQADLVAQSVGFIKRKNA